MWTIYVKDLSGSVTALEYDPTKPSKQLYDNLLEYYKNTTMKDVMLLDESQDDPFDLSNLVDGTILSLLIQDKPETSPAFFSSQQRKKNISSSMEYNRVICHINYVIRFPSAYQDPFEYPTHITLPLFLFSRIDERGFLVDEYDMRSSPDVAWSPTLRSALIAYHDRQKKYVRTNRQVTDTEIDYIVYLWYSQIN